MSRIQQILDKAQREGYILRTTALESPPAAAPVAPAGAHPAAMPPPAYRSTAVEPGTPRASRPPEPSLVPVADPVITPARVAPAVVPHRLLVAAAAPHSVVAEQYRALRTRITQAEADRPMRALLVTSPCPADGKTVTALNLACTMAQEIHRRVLVIDADVRNGGVHRLLGLPAAPGLSDVLSGNLALADALIALPSWRLTVLTTGSPVDNPTETLGSAEMRRLLDGVRAQFDRVVVDTPPASPLADVSVLAPLMDGVLVVVRAGQTPRPAIERTVAELGPERLLGLVLNDVEETPPPYGTRETVPPRFLSAPDLLARPDGPVDARA